jgi:hypothetical protein
MCEKKVVLVTGVTSGIGAGTASLLSEQEFSFRNDEATQRERHRVENRGTGSARCLRRGVSALRANGVGSSRTNRCARQQRWPRFDWLLGRDRHRRSQGAFRDKFLWCSANGPSSSALNASAAIRPNHQHQFSGWFQFAKHGQIGLCAESAFQLGQIRDLVLAKVLAKERRIEASRSHKHNKARPWTNTCMSSAAYG